MRSITVVCISLTSQAGRRLTWSSSMSPSQRPSKHITRAPAPSTCTTGSVRMICGWNAISPPSIGTRGSTLASLALFALIPTYFPNRWSTLTTEQQAYQESGGCLRNMSSHRGSSGRCRCHHQGTYDAEDTLPQKERQGETSRSGMVPLRQMQEADNLHMQQMHAHYRWITEAVLVLQCHDGGREQVFC